MKRGEESGYVRITLRGNTKEEKITITRKMDIHNKSEWLFNGKTSCIWSITNLMLLAKIVASLERSLHGKLRWTSATAGNTVFFCL